MGLSQCIDKFSTSECTGQQCIDLWPCAAFRHSSIMRVKHRVARRALCDSKENLDTVLCPQHAAGDRLSFSHNRATAHLSGTSAPAWAPGRSRGRHREFHSRQGLSSRRLMRKRLKPPCCSFVPRCPLRPQPSAAGEPHPELQGPKLLQRPQRVRRRPAQSQEFCWRTDD